MHDHRDPGGNRGIPRDILCTRSLGDESQRLVGCAERLDRVATRIPVPDAWTDLQQSGHHPRLRNRLGIDKAQKLVICYRMLRGTQELEY